MQTDIQTARAIIGDINSWEIQSIAPSDKVRDGWVVTIGSTPRIVGDLLPRFDEGSEDGTIFALEARDGTAEFDETVQLRRAPYTTDGDEYPGVVMWGILTCAYESTDRGTFEGTIAFYEDEDEGDALMSVATTDIGRITADRALHEIETAINMLDGNGPFVLDHGERLLAQASRLNAILSVGIAARKLAQ